MLRKVYLCVYVGVRSIANAECKSLRMHGLLSVIELAFRLPDVCVCVCVCQFCWGLCMFVFLLTYRIIRGANALMKFEESRGGMGAISMQNW